MLVEVGKILSHKFAIAKKDVIHDTYKPIRNSNEECLEIKQNASHFVFWVESFMIALDPVLYNVYSVTVQICRSFCSTGITAEYLQYTLHKL